MAAQQTGFLRHDGRRIAYASVGDGPPLVMPAWWVSNVVEDWNRERFRGFIERLAEERRVIRYDRLGCGQSDHERPPETLSAEYEADLLGAVLDHLELERVTVVGGSCGGATSVVYATREPERVERMVLYGSFANGADLAPAQLQRSMVELVRAHWGLGSKLLADFFVPSGDADERRGFAAFQRESADAETAAVLLQLIYDTDVREHATRVEVPTLVVHRRGDRAIRLPAGERLASLIPGAELVALDGDAHTPWDGDQDELLAAMAPFLGLAPVVRETPREAEELTAREREVLALVAEGLSDGDIAARLVVSPHTVHRHVANIFRKLGLNSRAAAAAWAARSGMA